MKNRFSISESRRIIIPAVLLILAVLIEIVFHPIGIFIRYTQSLPTAIWQKVALGAVVLMVAGYILLYYRIRSVNPRGKRVPDIYHHHTR